MSEVVAHASVRALEVEQVVLRCGCSNEQKRAADYHAFMGEPCPKPGSIENNGVVVRWHRNPLRRALYRVRRFITGKV
jgi:hypothetical protein